jgi:cell division septum initiation protein DivIVA
VTNHSHRHDSPQYQTPTSIRDESFQRRMMGLDANKVYEYLDLLADQVQATERQLSEGRAANERLQAELQRTQTKLRQVQAELDDYEHVGDRVNEQVIQLFSQAQLVAEEMVQDVSRDARDRIAQARAHERKIVQEAMDTAGKQVRTYAQSAQTQMQSIMESFASEVDRLGSKPVSGEPAPHQNDPLHDAFGDWQIRFPNGSGPESPGSD